MTSSLHGVIATCENCGGDLYYGTFGAKERRAPSYQGYPDPERWRHANGRIMCPTSTEEQPQYATPKGLAPTPTTSNPVPSQTMG